MKFRDAINIINERNLNDDIKDYIRDMQKKGKKADDIEKGIVKKFKLEPGPAREAYLDLKESYLNEQTYEIEVSVRDGRKFQNLIKDRYHNELKKGIIDFSSTTSIETEDEELYLDLYDFLNSEVEIINYTKHNELNEEVNLDKIIGYLKGKYKTIAQVKKCPKFKNLTDADKEYVIDELKADGWD